MLQHRNPEEMTELDAAAALVMLKSGGRLTPSAMESNNNYSPPMGLDKPREQADVPANKTRTSSRSTKNNNNNNIQPLSPSVPVVAPSVAQPKVLEPQSLLLTEVDRIRRRVPAVATFRPDENGSTMERRHHMYSSSSSEGESATGVGGGDEQQQQQRGSYPFTSHAERRRRRCSSSSSPTDLVVARQRWDSSRTSSPIVPGPSNELTNPQPWKHESYDREQRNGPPMVYDSPGMNGFALRLIGKGIEVRLNHDGSSPEPHNGTPPAPVLSLSSRKKQAGVNRKSRKLAAGTAASSSHVEDKSLHSPTDSGVSSIHDDITLQPNLNIKLWTKGLSVGDGLPSLVRVELRKIVEASAYNKRMDINSKMVQYPLDFEFNPKKSRYRKECVNECDKFDRERNNAASRRSRHKKKLMMRMMSISLEYDRNENSQLYLQERWLTSMIIELEEKLLSRGTEPHVLRKLRANCGFQ